MPWRRPTWTPGRRSGWSRPPPSRSPRSSPAAQGLTGALGTVAESIGGVHTGKLVGEPLHGPAKAEAVRALSAEGLELGRCAAYSDSHNDIPMPSLVGHPYAINPDAKLRKYARERDWRLRDYRTGRKAAKVGIPAAAGVGAVAGGTAAAIALHRRRR